MSGPDPGPAEIGVVVKLSGGLLSKTAIVTAIEAGVLSLLSKGDAIQNAALQDFARLEVIRVPGPAVISGPGRLMAAHLAAQSGQIKAKWNAERVTAAAASLANCDVATRRAVAADWLALGLVDHVDALDLSASELLWCKALFAARSGDAAATITFLEGLPPTGYEQRVDLLVRLSEAITADPDLSARAARLAVPFAEGSRLAKGLVAGLSPTDFDTRMAAVADLLSDMPPGGIMTAEMHRLARAIGEDSAGQPAAPEQFRAAAALSVYRRGMGGDNVDSDAGLLLPGRLPLYDDLIDRGALTPGCFPYLRVQNRPLTYVTARIDPSVLGIAELHEIPHTAEIARQYFVAKDRAALSGLARDDRDAAHYSALLDIAMAGHGNREQLRPAARAILQAVDAYQEALASDRNAVPPPGILQDPTTWRLFLKQALSGRISLGTEERSRYPEFAIWLDLCEVESCIFAADWSGAIDLGTRLLERVTEERISDEIKNLCAYAHYQQGNDRAAMDLLTHALDGVHTQALMINSSIVAAGLGSEYAAQFLARIYEEADDSAVGIEALLKGIQLWLNDPDSLTPPEALLHGLRNALARTAPDDTLRILARFAAIHDGAWMATAPPISTVSPAQEDIARFYVVRARSGQDGYGESMVDVAKELVAINRKASPPEWAKQELAALTSMLMDDVHVEFGEAAHLGSVVEILLLGGVLPLREALILGPQAGAHLASKFAADGDTLSPQAEKNFLWDPLEAYLSAGQDIPAGSKECIADEMHRCISLATMCMLEVTEKMVERFSREWNPLVERERWDYQNRSTILRQEQKLLDDIGRWVERCAFYDRQGGRLPCPEEFKETQRSMRRQIDGWKSDLARLKSQM